MVSPKETVLTAHSSEQILEGARPIFEFFEREVKIGLGRKKTIKIGLLGNVNDIISYLSYDIIECFLTMWSATPYKLPWGHIKHSLGSTCYYNHFDWNLPDDRKLQTPL